MDNLNIKVDSSKCKYSSGCCDSDSNSNSCCCSSGCCSSTSSNSCCNGQGCAEVCPSKAITRTNGKVLINHQKCTQCGLCIDVCPYDAISLQ